jgi:hypothetical protein
MLKPAKYRRENRSDTWRAGRWDAQIWLPNESFASRVGSGAGIFSGDIAAMVASMTEGELLNESERTSHITLG